MALDKTTYLHKAGTSRLAAILYHITGHFWWLHICLFHAPNLTKFKPREHTHVSPIVEQFSLTSERSSVPYLDLDCNWENLFRLTLRYFHPLSESQSLPDPRGPLSTSLSPATIRSANEAVQETIAAVKSSKLRGTYGKVHSTSMHQSITWLLLIKLFSKKLE